MLLAKFDPRILSLDFEEAEEEPTLIRDPYFVNQTERL